MIRVQLKIPFGVALVVGRIRLRDGTGPCATEAFDVSDRGGAQAILPFQTCLNKLQRLVESRCLKFALGHVDAPVPTATWCGGTPFPTQRCAGRAGKFPAVIQWMPESRRYFEDVLHSFDVSLDGETPRTVVKVMRKTNAHQSAALVRRAKLGARRVRRL